MNIKCVCMVSCKEAVPHPGVPLPFIFLLHATRFDMQDTDYAMTVLISPDHLVTLWLSGHAVATFSWTELAALPEPETDEDESYDGFL